MVHASKYGSTREYAERIAAALDAPVKASSDVTAKQLAGEDLVVFCSAVYGPMLRDSSVLRAAVERGTATRWVLVTVGLGDPLLSIKRDELVATKFPLPLRERLRVVHLRGAMDMEKLSFFDRSMMKTIRRSLSAKLAHTAEDDAMLAALEPTRISFIDDAGVDAVVAACLG